MRTDLLDLGVPVLFVGDHGQLPPVNSRGRSFMERPDVRLERIHRQASGSPVLRLAMEVRRTGRLPAPGAAIRAGDVRIRRGAAEWLESEEDWSDLHVLTLCYTNRSRVRYNKMIGGALYRPPEPVPGDRLICRRNNNEAGIHNGMVGRLASVERFSVKQYRVSIDLGNGRPLYEGLIWEEQFNSERVRSDLPRYADLWDFGYCLTVHNAQGSEAERVRLIAERPPGWIHPDDWRRWLYTGVTRATRELTILVPSRDGA